MIQIHTFKEKGKEGGEGRPQFGGQWKVPCLVAFGRRRRNILFTSFYFPPHKILLKPFFSLILGFCFTMVLNHYYAFFLNFHWLINDNHAFWSTNYSAHSSPNWFWSKMFFFPWTHGVMHDYVLWISSRTNEWRTTLGVILRFHIDPTPSWWRSQTMRGAPLFQSQTPLSLILSNFFKLSYLGDFVIGRPPLWR